ncbi:UPF0613 protein [Yarrowia sp. C11]|nr:UPF0613 protein [Yarrowia sp. E02]KAG5369732.1 UPF0613 protein [Yarrowia sp. C11]
MDSKYPPGPYTGSTVHEYYATRIGYEHPTRSGAPHTNTVMFIGELGDCVTSVTYLKPLADALDKSGWGVFEPHFFSSATSWGIGSQNFNDIEEAVKYLTTKLEADGLPNKQKIVLLGHGEGCLDIMHYLTRGKRLANVNGAILQAQVSFTGNMSFYIDKIHRRGFELYNSTDKLENGSTYTNPAGVSQFHALPGPRIDDDFLELEFCDSFLEEWFDNLDVPLLFLMSEEGGFLEDRDEKQEILNRYESFVNGGYWSKLSAVVEGNSRNDTKKAINNLVKKMAGFIKGI